MGDFRKLEQWAKDLGSDYFGQLSTHAKLEGKEKGFLYKIAKSLRKNYSLSVSQLRYLKSIIEKVDALEHMQYGTQHDLEKAAESGEFDEVKHLSVRMAWHDSGWNGRICKDPAANVHCVGEHSLLSTRVRTRRNLEIENKEDCRDTIPNADVLGDYLPPCFWSINAFSPSGLSVVHDNPAASEFPQIREELPGYSVISWPFKLAFVKSANEQKEYGRYYPKPIFESRIKKFQNHLKEKESIVFLYCKYSNPVSGEDFQYLLVGCALLSEKGGFNYFKPTIEQLKEKQAKKDMQNFPTLNWALRYRLDIENTGVRLPYQEYLQEIDKPGGLSREYLDEIKVTVTEPELSESFSYVSKHVDDDQAVFLLMKLRKSILKVMEHQLEIDFNSGTTLKNIDELLKFAWSKRGYLPGLRNIYLAAMNLSPSDTEGIARLLSAFSMKDPKSVEELRDCLVDPSRIDESLEACEDVLCELAERIEELGINPDDFLRLASLNLTHLQFRRIINRKGLDRSLREICENPYLIFEEYEEGEMLEDQHSGEKVDGPIDLFKVDIALFPQIRFLKKSTILHAMKIGDPRRLRAVSLAELSMLKDKGHCFDEAACLQERTKQYPLFYKTETEYEVQLFFGNLPPAYVEHFEEKLVLRKDQGKTYFYLKTVFDDEQFVSHTIQTLIRAEDIDVSLQDLSADLEKSALALKKRLKASFDEEQFLEERKTLYQKLPRKRFLVISGTPGSGKSYELLKFVDSLSLAGETSLILTITGKASLRLKNNSEGFQGIDAKTIDKFLVENEKAKSENAKITKPNLIIDEMSMVDLDKLAEILRLLKFDSPYFNRLILVGDESQLPPIGAGKVFEDILDYLRSGEAGLREHWVHLDVNCRAEMSTEFQEFCGIFSNQNKGYEEWFSKIDNGKQLCPGLEIHKWQTHKELEEQIDKRFLELFSDVHSTHEDKEKFLDRALGIAQTGKPQNYNLDCFQLLSPYRTGRSGASGLNFFFQENYRISKGFSGATGEMVFKVKDKVIHTQNEYKENALFVSNGSLGAITGYKQLRFVEHDKGIKLGQLKYPDKLELAYCITVHKSQGSGFNHVFIVIPKRYGILNRELLYTALTRTRESVTLFIQVDGGENDASGLLNRIRRKSDIETRRTSLLKGSDLGYAYIPDTDINVKSRVEYIIYKKLEDCRKRLGDFEFWYEDTYELSD